MTTQAEVLRALAASLPALGERYGVRSLSLFGSWARGDQREESDVDIAVRFDDPPSLWGYIELREELSAAVGRPVDLVCRDRLRPRVLERVERDEVCV